MVIASSNINHANKWSYAKALAHNDLSYQTKDSTWLLYKQVIGCTISKHYLIMLLIFLKNVSLTILNSVLAILQRICGFSFFFSIFNYFRRNESYNTMKRKSNFLHINVLHILVIRDFPMNKSVSFRNIFLTIWNKAIQEEE